VEDKGSLNAGSGPVETVSVGPQDKQALNSAGAGSGENEDRVGRSRNEDRVGRRQSVEQTVHRQKR
jgi:hypothetical protein